jgi:hypothetical protein
MSILLGGPKTGPWGVDQFEDRGARPHEYRDGAVDGDLDVWDWFALNWWFDTH